MKAVKVILTIVALLLVAGGVAYQVWLKPQLVYADVAANYAAKKFCSCLFVAELTVDQCKADFSEDVSMATFIPDADGASVEILGGRISARAQYRDGLGCTLMPEA